MTRILLRNYHRFDYIEPLKKKKSFFSLSPFFNKTFHSFFLYANGAPNSHRGYQQKTYVKLCLKAQCLLS